MSTKDMNYKRICCICGDTLVGTDDGLEVYESLVEQLKELDAGTADYEKPGCGLCGEHCSITSARDTVAAGPPKLLLADGTETDEV